MATRIEQERKQPEKCAECGGANSLAGGHKGRCSQIRGWYDDPWFVTHPDVRATPSEATP